jgi:hypothetical protein
MEHLNLTLSLKKKSEWVILISTWKTVIGELCWEECRQFGKEIVSETAFKSLLAFSFEF